MAYSFYGGKEGASFLIKATFSSVQEMLEAFRQGGSYNKVGYGEFVIINTPNKRDCENGAVFRRGFDFLANGSGVKPNANDYWRLEPISGSILQVGGTIQVEDNGNRVVRIFDTDGYQRAVDNYLINVGAGAKYIGRFVGPEGSAAPLELLSWSDFVTVYQNASADERYKNDNITLERTSGKETDVAKAGYCTLVDAEGNVLNSFFSLDLPIDIFEVQAESASAYGPTILSVSQLPTSNIKTDVYYKKSNKYYLWENNEWIERQPWTATRQTVDGQEVWNYTGLIREKQESEGHPYYYSYDIKIPKGIHGKDVKEVGINVSDRADGTHDVSQANHNYEWYVKTIDYTQSDAGTTTTTWLDNYHKVIDRITTNMLPNPDLANRADSTNYNAGDYVQFSQNNSLALLCSKAGKTASSAPSVLSSVIEGYHFTDGTVEWVVVQKNTIPANKLIVHYTHDGNQELTIRLLQSIEQDSDGRVYAKYSDIQQRSYVGINKSIIKVGYTDSITENNVEHPVCRFYVAYNTYKRNAQGNIVIDKNFTWNTDGSIKTFPTTDANGREIEYINQAIKFITNITYDEDNDRKIKVHYNTGETDKFNEAIRVIKSITYDEDNDKKINIHYNTADPNNPNKDEIQKIDEAIRVIKNITYDEDNDKKINIHYNTADPNNPNKDEIQKIDEALKIIKKLEWKQNANNSDHSKEGYNFVTTFNTNEVSTDSLLLRPVKNIAFKNQTLDDSHKFQVTYDTGTNRTHTIDISNSVNYVEAVQTYRQGVYVLYSDPAVRAQWDDVSKTDPADGSVHFASYNNSAQLYPWVRIGMLQSEGIGVYARHFTSETELKTLYPYGFGRNASGGVDTATLPYKGWIAQVDENGDNNVAFYVFDYTSQDNNTWLLCGHIGEATVHPEDSVIISSADSDNLPLVDGDKLNDKGLWFVIEENPLFSRALKFSSDDDFTLSVSTPNWDGTIEYSINNGNTWTVWDGSELSGTSSQSIWLRGSNNTKITGSGSSTYKWTFTGKYITGNIETLLDYQTVLNGQHPSMGDYCYSYMFYGCASLIQASKLSATTLAIYCYYYMFNACTSLTQAPELPATTLAGRCYDNMFNACTSLTQAPELPATTLAAYCYRNMFRSCTSLTTIPKLPTIRLANQCYYFMFEGCSSLKLSTTQTGIYQYPYRIPTSGTGVIATDSLRGMFYSTGGTFTNNPNINTTYYTDHEPV